MVIKAGGGNKDVLCFFPKVIALEFLFLLCIWVFFIFSTIFILIFENYETFTFPGIFQLRKFQKKRSQVAIWCYFRKFLFVKNIGSA